MAPRGEVEPDMEEGSPPDAPLVLEITDFDATLVRLKWKAPVKDGGSPVTFYTVEYKGRGEEDWQAAPKVKADKNPRTAVEGLTTGNKYEFRVFAENRAGRGPASDPAGPQLCKAQKAPAAICRKTLVDRVVKVNQQLDLCVPVAGEPAPDCIWKFNGQELKSGDNVKVSYATNVAKLLLIPARRANEGKYSLEAKNKWAEDTVEVEVSVFGRPTVPTGPLVVSDVTKRSCSLSWKPPSDNGGKPIEHYEVEKMDECTGAWLPAGNPKGTSWELRNLVEGRNYKFLVRAVNEDGDSPNLETEDFITAKNPFEVPSQPGKVKPADWGVDWAELQWKAPEDDGGAEVREYKVEMRCVDKRAWVELGRTRETQYRAEKCGIELGLEYVFRVTAYNAGGESETSEPSQAITAMERFVKPRLDKDLLGKEREMCAGQMLRLEGVAVAEPPAKFAWFLPNGEPLLHNGDRINIDTSEKNKSTLILKNVDRAQGGSFRVECKNSTGLDEHEIRVDILAPPAKPTGPVEVSKVTPTGCTLNWTKPKDDGGSPIQGYSIERKDVEKDYWSPCGKVAGKMATVMRELEFEVNDLVENFVYVFRVMAYNAIGEGAPLMTPCPTIAKFELDPPNQPYNINVVDFDKKWVKLDWSVAPGPKAVKYVVEKVETFLIPKDEEEEEKPQPAEGEEGEEKPKMVAGVSLTPAAPREPGKHQEYVEYTSGWMVAGTTEDDMPEIKLTDLQEGYKYQFRVKAVNRAGASYPSESTDEITAKTRKQKPIIDRSMLPKEVSVAKGENLTMKVKVQGEPVTDKAWFWGRREIKSSSSVVIDNSDYAAKMVVMNLERADTGTFSFRAENDHGSAECSVEVNVMVAPQKPRGPMRIDNVCGEGCTAAWAAPEDDGGSPVVYYMVERAQGQGESWVPCGRVNAPETEVKVCGLTQDKDYRLRVFAVNAMGDSEPLVCVDSFITENPYSCPGAPGRPELRDWDSDHFDMKWVEPRNDGGSRVLGYELEARLWRDPNWFRAGEVRMAMEHGLVEGVELGQGYAVRVRARNAAGWSPWSIESEQVVCKHKNLKPKVKLAGPKDVVANEGETLTLLAEVQGEPPAQDIRWFVAGQEVVDDPKGGVVIDNSKEYKSKLQLDSVSRKHAGQVVCEASNLSGSGKAAVQLAVHGKPSIPEDRLIVSNITASGCKLSWGAAKNSGGLPLNYLVEKYTVASDSWAKQAVTANTELKVNDLEEGKEYEFRVFSENEVGESEPLSTARPIVAKNQYTVSLPPSQPDVVEWNERCMTITWKAPIDDGGMKITAYTVEARSTGGEWQIWECLDTPDTRAVMQKLAKGQEYQFRVIATNKAGKSEPSVPSRPKLAKETDLLPYIDAKSLRDMTVEVKDRLRFDVPIFGEPAPEVCWYKEDQTVEELGDRNISVMNTDGHTKIVINNITKAQAGKYSLVIKNRSGEDSAKFAVTVIDKPEAPEGPMQVTCEGGMVTLLWKKIKDDGGAPLEHYQLEKMDNEKQSWCACGHTKENTLAVPCLPGLTYRFRVTAVNRIGDSAALLSENISLGEGEDSQVRSL